MFCVWSGNVATARLPRSRGTSRRRCFAALIQTDALVPSTLTWLALYLNQRVINTFLQSLIGIPSGLKPFHSVPLLPLTVQLLSAVSGFPALVYRLMSPLIKADSSCPPCGTSSLSSWESRLFRPRLTILRPTDSSNESTESSRNVLWPSRMFLQTG